MHKEHILRNIFCFQTQPKRAPQQPVMAALEPVRPELLSGHRLHPTILDATLHLSAAALPTASSQAVVTLIPASIAALAISQMKQGTVAIPLAQPSEPRQDASVLCQYQLLTGGTCSVQLRDLLAKRAQMGKSAQPETSAASSGDVPTSELLYETQWQVDTSAAAAGASIAPQQPCFALSRPKRGLTSRRLAAAYGVRQPAGAGPSAATELQHGLCALLVHDGTKDQQSNGTAQAVSAMLELWQTHAAQCQGKTVSLLTQGQLGSHPVGTTAVDMASSAAVAALMRVAAAENPAISISCMISDILEALPSEVEPLYTTQLFETLCISLFIVLSLASTHFVAYLRSFL